MEFQYFVLNVILCFCTVVRGSKNPRCHTMDLFARFKSHYDEALVAHRALRLTCIGVAPSCNDWKR